MAVKLVIATRNLGKLREIQEILAELPLKLLSLNDFPKVPEFEENASTYLENAREKARLVAEHSGLWSLADDSGLEVEALEWRPGVYSARFAGAEATDRDNIQQLLDELQQHPGQRRAVFRCTMVLRHPDGREFVTEGELWGEIVSVPRGSAGFGYDPVFLIPERGETLAQMGSQEKNKISHRTKALEKMKLYFAKVLQE
jgi:XTP/dITP diphosphohydrolase